MAEETEAPEQPAGSGDATRRARSRPLGFAITLVIALIVFAGVGLLFHAQAYSSPAGTLVATDVGTSTVKGVALKHVTLHFNTYPDASGSVNGVPIHPGGNPAWPSYGPTNQYQVPAHALVTVTIRQYDSGGALNNAWFDKVRGTVGGTAVINGKTVTPIKTIQVGALPEAVMITPDGRYIYVGNFLDKDFSILKVNGLNVTDSGKKFAVPGHPASGRMGP